MAKDEIVIAGNAEGYIKELQRADTENKKTIARLKEVKDESRKAAREERERARDAKKLTEESLTPLEKYNKKQKELNDHLKKGRINQETYNRQMSKARDELRGATGNAEKFGKVLTVGMTGALAVLVQLRKEFNAFHDRLKAIQETSEKAAGSFAKLKTNFKADASVTDADLEKRVLEGAKETGTNVDIFSAALGPALSAKGSQDNDFAVRATIAALMFNRDASEAGALTGAVGDFSKFGESTDPRAILGFLANSQKNVRQLSVDQFAKSATPAVLATTQRGDTVEQATEIFATLANLSADQTGETTSTAMVNLVAKLEKAGIAGKNTTERIQTLQNNKELRETFLKENTFEAKATPAITALLSGDPQALKEYAAAQAGIGSLAVKDDQANVAAFEAEVKKVRGLDTVGGQFARATNRSAANIENFRLQSGGAARAEATRQTIFDTIDAVGIADFQKKKLKTGFDVAVEGQVTGLGADRGKASIEVARTIANELKKLVDNRGDRFVDEQIRLLQEMNSNLLKIGVQQQRAADAAEDVARNKPPAQNPVERMPAGKVN